MSSNRLTPEEALALLRSHGIDGTDEELLALVDACDADEAILNALELKNGLVAHSGYKLLGQKLARFRCGLRLTSIAERLAHEASEGRGGNANSDLAEIAHDRAMFLIDLGELKQAEEILRGPLVSKPDALYPGVEGRLLLREYPARLDLCDVLLLNGRLKEASFVADVVVGAFETDIPDPGLGGQSQSDWLYQRIQIEELFQSYSFTTGFNPYARRALAESLQGKVAEALADFKQAEVFQQRKFEVGGDLSLTTTRKWLIVDHRYERQGQSPPREEISAALDSEPVTLPLIGQAAIYYAMLLTRLGKLNTALKILDYSRRWAADPYNHFPGMQAFAEVALSDVYRLMGNHDEAQRYLEHPLAWAAETGQKEIDCWAHLSLARLALAQERRDDAEADVNECLQIATSHGFKLHEIDALVTAGRLARLRKDFETVRKNAGKAIETASHPYCGYAWAQGNALHLLAEAYSHPGYVPEYTYMDRAKPSLEKAERFVSSAIRIREQI